MEGPDDDVLEDPPPPPPLEGEKPAGGTGPLSGVQDAIPAVRRGGEGHGEGRGAISCVACCRCCSRRPAPLRGLTPALSTPLQDFQKIVVHGKPKEPERQRKTVCKPPNDQHLPTSRIKLFCFDKTTGPPQLVTTGSIADIAYVDCVPGAQNPRWAAAAAQTRLPRHPTAAALRV
jgi:hypothetical protein